MSPVRDEISNGVKVMERTILIIAFFWVITIFCSTLASARRGEGPMEVEYVGANYRDPFELPLALKSPIAPSEVELPAGVELEAFFRVEGMIWGSARPQVIIDGEVYDVGDVVKEAEIIGIDREGVVLFYKDRKFILRPKIERRQIGEDENED